MTKLKNKDEKCRLSYKKNEIKKIKNKLLNRIKNKNFLFNLEKKENKIYSSVKMINRCVISNRKNSINKRFNFSRIMLRNSVSNGLVIGLKKFYY